MWRSRTKQPATKAVAVLILFSIVILVLWFALFEGTDSYLFTIGSVGIRRSDLARTARLVCQAQSAAQTNSLHRRVEEQPTDCGSWLLLALLKARAGCSVEPKMLLQRGMRACSAREIVLRLQMSVFLNWLISGAPHNQLLKKHCLNIRMSSSCTRLLIYIVKEEASDSRGVPRRWEEVIQLHQHDSNPQSSIHERMEDVVIKYLPRGGEKALKAHIPDIIHFVFGMDDVRQTLKLHHYIAIRSAAEQNAHCEIFFHYVLEPMGKWWEHAKEVIRHIVQHTDITDFQGKCVHHYAHKADILRLQVINHMAAYTWT